MSLGQWLRPARTVPNTPWSNGTSNWKTNGQTFAILIFGLALFGAGEAAFIAANNGVTPWVVLAQGISVKTGLSIGWSTFWVSCTVLLLWIPLKRKPGLGTIMNIIVIAFMLDVMQYIFPHPTSLPFQILEQFFGVTLVGLASALYITCHLGAGPRDGLMTGLNEKTGVRVGRVRLTIEIIVLSVGIALGGQVGLGTAIFALFIGQSVALWFGVLERLYPDLNPHAHQ